MSANAEFLKTILTTCSGDDFFKTYEQYVNCVLPKNIKNILTLNAYKNAYAMSLLKNEQIKEIEQFMANDFCVDMLQNSESVKDYLGLYFREPQKFKLVSGEKALIMQIAEVCKTLFETQASKSQELLPFSGKF